MHGNLKYDKLEDKIPYITGSFTGWRYKKMIRLDQFTREIDKDFLEPIEIGKRESEIRRRVESPADFNEYEVAIYKVICANQRKKYRVEWATYFQKYLSYKLPYLINGAHFTSIDDSINITNLEDENYTT